MEHTYVDAKNMKDLDGYVVSLVMGMMTLKTLEAFHIKAINLGVLKEEHESRVNTMIWDIRRLIKTYQDQVESLLEMLPDDFNATKIIEMLKKYEVTKARSLVRKAKEKRTPKESEGIK